jgi:NAD(P)H-hydrate epimerase
MTRDEVRAVDAWAINEMGVPGVVLMENAGRACAELVKERIAQVKQPCVGIVCGTGNNGGDGYVIARHLINDGIEVRVVLCGPREKVRGDAAVNLAILEKQGQEIRQLDVNATEAPAQIQTLLGQTELVVDAIFGTGLHGQLNEAWIHFIEGINALGVSILAVDIPSGLDCDSGQALGAVVRATDTVTFVARKRGFTSATAQTYLGRVQVASIGIAPKEKGR